MSRMAGPMLAPQTPRLPPRPVIKQSVSPPPLTQSQYIMAYIQGILHDEDFELARRWRAMPDYMRQEITARLQMIVPRAMADFLDRENDIWHHPSTWGKFQEATMGLISLIPALELELERMHHVQSQSRLHKGRERRVEPPLYKSVLVNRAQTTALRQCSRPAKAAGVSRIPQGEYYDEEDPFADP